MKTYNQRIEEKEQEIHDEITRLDKELVDAYRRLNLYPERSNEIYQEIDEITEESAKWEQKKYTVLDELIIEDDVCGYDLLDK